MSDGSAWGQPKQEGGGRSWLERIHVDAPLLILVLLALVYGLVVFYSASGSHAQSPDPSAVAETITQAKTIGIALLVMLFVAQIPSLILKVLAPLGMLVSLILLLLVQFSDYGLSGGGAQRWLDLGALLGVGTYVMQPSELLKIVVPLVIALWVAVRWPRFAIYVMAFITAPAPLALILHFNGYTLLSALLYVAILVIFVMVGARSPRFIIHWAGLAVTAIPVGILAVQPDVGTAGVVFLAGFVALFLGKMPRILMFIMALFAGALALDTFVAMEPMKQYVDDHPEIPRSKALFEARDLAAETSVIGKHLFFKPYHYQRIFSALYPDDTDQHQGYQSNQALIAIGSGGMFGYGWLKGPQSHNSWVPERDTDFVFVVMAEDFGLAGALLYLLLCLFITIRGLMISAAATNTFDRVLAGTLSLMFFVYVFVNIAMVTGLLPVVGIPLPLVSRGGTFLLVVMVSFGILMSIHTHKGEQAR